MPGGDKTEKGTPKKREDARKKGEVLQSKEVVTAVVILATFSMLNFMGKFMLVQLTSFMETRIIGIGTDQVVNSDYIMRLARDILLVLVMVCGPIIAVAGLSAVLTVVVQTRGLFTVKPMAPKFSKLNPFSGIKRLFSLQTVITVLKGIVVITFIGVIIYNKIMDKMPEILKLLDVEPIQGLAYLASSAMDVVMTISILFAFVAAADFLFQWWQYEKKLRMSKQEVKDEYKQLEGDPQVKGRIKQKQQAMAQIRMMAEVPTADVVVRNPTHYAVAIRYDQHKDIAPVIVAKGAYFLAMRIIDLAKENSVYIEEDRPLARTLYDTVEVGHFIPKELYLAIAEILAVVYELKDKKLT